MAFRRYYLAILTGMSLLALSACGSNGFFGQRVLVGQEAQTQTQQADPRRETIWDLFTNVDDPNTTVEVNKYIWNASLDVLDFMPVEAADPFSGIIVFGYGTPPGSGRSYKATVYVSDPSLDARALNVSLYTRSGPASREAVLAIEDAILTRARQLRIADGRL
ncbi:MAG TPA: DUF3576 domain-containing protein [Aliiroseovarius sp.]|nr:DUF3576 domain-containing protein [Aliiroseovarius sp.]